MRVKKETRRWCCFSSSTSARSKSAEKMSRTTRTERSASWNTIAGATVSSTRLWSTSLSLKRYCSSRSKSSRVAPCAAVRMIAPPPGEVELLRLAPQAGALLVVEALGHPDALARGGVDHVAPGDGELHRQAGALRLQRVLDDLHDDLLAGLEEVGDLLAALLAPAAPRRLDARQHDLVDVEEAVLVEADVDERGLQPGQDVVDLALVDVPDDGAVAPSLEVQLGDAEAGGRVLLAAAGRRDLVGVRLSCRLQQRHAGLPAIDAHKHLLTHLVVWVLQVAVMRPLWDAAARPCA